MSIGKFVRETILANPEVSTEDILTAVVAQYPNAKTTASCIAWYKSDMRKKGLLGGGRSKVAKVDPMVKMRQDLEAAKEELELLETKGWVKQRIKSLKLAIDDYESQIQTWEEDKESEEPEEPTEAEKIEDILVEKAEQAAEIQRDIEAE